MSISTIGLGFTVAALGTAWLIMEPPATLEAPVAIEYSYDRGAIPPPYHFSYLLRVSEDGEGSIELEGSEAGSWSESFVVGAEDLDRLTEFVADRDMFGRAWTPSDEMAAGADTERLTLRSSGQRVSVSGALASGSDRRVLGEMTQLLHDMLPAQVLYRIPSPIPARYPRN